MSSVLNSSSLRRVTRTSSCTFGSVPTGMTRRPPIASCALSDVGTLGPPAATTIAITEWMGFISITTSAIIYVPRQFGLKRQSTLSRRTKA